MTGRLSHKTLAQNPRPRNAGNSVQLALRITYVVVSRYTILFSLSLTTLTQRACICGGCLRHVLPNDGPIPASHICDHLGIGGGLDSLGNHHWVGTRASLATAKVSLFYLAANPLQDVLRAAKEVRCHT